MPVYPPLEHYDYTIIDTECICDVCAQWREKHKEFENILRATQGHKKDCRCGRCLLMRKAMAAYLAALNRRDLYCEIAWHATHSPSGQAMMTWVTQEISRRTDNWWYMEGPKIELESWLDLFERQKWMNGTIYDAVSGMINGAMSMIVSGSPA